MKERLTVCCLIIFCLVLCLFSLASCGGGGEETTVSTEPEPEATVPATTAGGGKLVLQNVIGYNPTITKIGGEGKNYWVNGQQIEPNRYPDDGYWGRVEISLATGNETDQMLNVMYVCDADKNIVLAPSAIESDGVKGARIGKVAAVFVTSATRRSTEITFDASGSGELNYYVSGVRAGTWTVTAGGATQTVTATEDGGFLAFTAPAGQVTLTPAD